jgi:hypothetical protein
VDLKKEVRRPIEELPPLPSSVAAATARSPHWLKLRKLPVDGLAEWRQAGAAVGPVVERLDAVS